MVVTMLCNYGKLKINRRYKAIDEGLDWVKIGNLFVSKEFVIVPMS